MWIASSVEFGPGIRLVAVVSNTTKRPSAEMSTSVDDPSAATAPAFETSRIVDVWMSTRKTSATPFGSAEASPPSRFDASETNATHRPSADTAGP